MQQPGTLIYDKLNRTSRNFSKKEVVLYTTVKIARPKMKQSYIFISILFSENKINHVYSSPDFSEKVSRSS